MGCCQCKGIEELFNEELVSRELVAYRKDGPDKITLLLVDAIKQAGIRGRTLLDIGGGVGAIQHELLEGGVENATDVDASSAYLGAARQEAERRGLTERIRFLHGNFVDLAASIPPADIVTLNRVICCYDDMVNLVSLSAERTRRLLGLVFPHNAWWLRLGLALMNLLFKLGKNPYRAFSHPTREIEDLIHKRGFHRIFYRKTFIWQIAVYSI